MPHAYYYCNTDTTHCIHCHMLMLYTRNIRNTESSYNVIMCFKYLSIQIVEQMKVLCQQVRDERHQKYKKSSRVGKKRTQKRHLCSYYTYLPPARAKSAPGGDERRAADSLLARLTSLETGSAYTYWSRPTSAY